MVGVSMIKQVTAVATRTVKIGWNDGSHSTHDLTPILYNRRSLVPLRENERLFREVKVGTDGRSISWPPNYTISAVTILGSPNNVMTSSDFIRISEEAGLSVEALSKVLGVSRRLITVYRQAAKVIPAHIALAMRHLEQTMTRG
ncbi:hypothetical protein GCM10011321_14830 [Youhaiella tibetensis]|nr:hypothetical protein GCM10011321_14830 [Youhaiella tibetensis]